MSLDDWILALHVLSAAAYGAAIILFWVLVVAVRKTDTAEGTLRLGPIVMVGNVAVGIGAGRDDHLRHLARALGRATTTSGTAGSSRRSCCG